MYFHQLFLNFLFFFSLQTTHSPDNDRFYTLRKRPAPVTERTTTFVCYTCGSDTPSSQLRLVYCCPNAEREPYFPFIKTMKPFKNASPISPQGKYTIIFWCFPFWFVFVLSEYFSSFLLFSPFFDCVHKFYHLFYLDFSTSFWHFFIATKQKFKMFIKHPRVLAFNIFFRSK